jgi:hypothetical protein
MIGGARAVSFPSLLAVAVVLVLALFAALSVGEAAAGGDGNSAQGEATPEPGQNAFWGDANCSGSADPIDSLLTLRYDAGLSANTGECPLLGEFLDVENASLHQWGDVDCSEFVDPIDSLKLLRDDAGLPVSKATPSCPDIQSSVVLRDAVGGKGGRLGVQMTDGPVVLGPAQTPISLPPTGGYPLGEGDGTPWEAALVLALLGLAGLSAVGARRLLR